MTLDGGRREPVIAVSADGRLPGSGCTAVGSGSALNVQRSPSPGLPRHNTVPGPISRWTTRWPSAA